MTELDPDYHVREWTPPTWAQWRERAESMLGRPVDGVATRIDDVVIPPLRADDDRAALATAPGGEPGWSIVESLDAVATPQVTDALRDGAAGGATLAWRSLATDADEAAAPGWMQAAEATVPLVLHAGARAPAVWAARPAGVAAAGLLWDPLTASADDPAPAYDALAALTREVIASGASTATALADGARVHDAGHSPATELAAAIGIALAHARGLLDRGVAARELPGRVWLRLSVGEDVFVEIAKLRAARRLWCAALARLGADPSGARVVARTSWRRLSRLDAPVNLLRHTTAAFAAVVGGADLVEIRPHTAPADARTRRWARNIHHLLAGEAWLGHVADPAAGSATLEHLTADLAGAAWSIATRIAGADPAAAPRATLAAAPPWAGPPQTGADLYPDPAPPAPVPTDAAPPVRPDLSPRRRAEAFEAVREVVAAIAPPPTAAIQLVSPRGAVRAELAAARELVARLGLAADVVETVAETTLVVLVGTADDLAADQVAAARAAGARVVVASGSVAGADGRTAPLLADAGDLSQLASRLGGGR